MTHRHPRSLRRLACVMLLALAVGACSAPAAPTGGPTPTPATPTTAAMGTPASPAGTIDLSDRHADPELEAMLPATLGGTVLVRESQLGIDLSTSSEALESFLAELGRTIDDFSLASAYAGGDLKAEVGAWRVRGADPTRLLDGFVRAVQASSATPVSVTPLELAGREVTRIGSEGELARGPLYAYVLGEVILFVQTPLPQLAEEAIGKLPMPSAPAPS